MRHEFIAIRGIDNNLQEWTYYTDELLSILYTRFPMSRTAYLRSTEEYKLGVL